MSDSSNDSMVMVSSQIGDDSSNCDTESVDLIANGDEGNGNEERPAEEDVEESPGERRDIKQALEVVGIVKNTIQFHDDESLQHALDKVKERPLIDDAFGTKVRMLERLKKNESYSYFHPAVEEALTQLTEVKEKAMTGKTTLSRPIEILNEVLPVFEKACSVFMEKVELSGVVNKNLNTCDQLRGQIRACISMDRQDIDEAKRLEKDCDKLLEDSVRGSKADIERVLEKLREEKEADILAWFESTRTENCQKMDFLTSDFHQMKENCDEDIEFTSTTLKMQVERKLEASEKFAEKDTELADMIDQDRSKEEELRKQLQEVEQHRRTLEEEREARKETQERANFVHKQTEDELELLLINLDSLRKRVDTADVVLTQTRDVCNKLFDKAVESKSLKNQDLMNLLGQSRQLSHCALIAQAVHCKNNVETTKGTVTYLNDKIKKRKVKLQDALQRKLAKEVKEHQEKLKNLSSDLDSSKKILQKSDEKLKILQGDINALQEHLDESDIEYESFQDAYERFKKQEEGLDGFSLSSIS